MPATIVMGGQWGDEGKGKLTDALAPGNWVDSNHLQPTRGTVVFDDNRDAAATIVQMLADRQTQVPRATLVSMLLTIVQVDRLVASAQVAQALAGKADQAKAGAAKGELGRSDEAASAGDAVSVSNYLVPASEDATCMARTVQQGGGAATYLLLCSPTRGGHHNERFDFDEDLLGWGVDLCAQLTGIEGG